MNKKLSILVLTLLFSILVINTIEINGNNFMINASVVGNFYLTSSDAETIWAADGVPVADYITVDSDPQIVCDGSGGAIIAWVASNDIYAQKIDSAGNRQWAPTQTGVMICNATNIQTAPQICSDGAGGAIITWEDWRNGANKDVYAQRIDSTGTVLWTPNGAAICMASNHSSFPKICSDGANGAVIAWEDTRGSLVDPNIYAQRINSTGDIKWPTDGAVICQELVAGPWIQQATQICSDGTGGAFIVWTDDRGGAGTNNDIIANRINGTGNVFWGFGGLGISGANNDQINPQICNDGSGGAIIVWQDYRIDTSGDTYAQKINATGIFQWGAGVAVCTVSGINGIQRFQKLCSDGSGGAIFTWEDYRDNNWDIYAQNVNTTGYTQWTANGTLICIQTDHQNYPEICSDGSGGAIITWNDNRSGHDIYAQKINSAGSLQWGSSGVAICTADNDQEDQQICCDGLGGAIITWWDKRGGNFDIYAQGVIDSEDDLTRFLLMALAATSGEEGFLGLGTTTWLMIGLGGVVFLIIMFTALGKKK